MSTPATTVVVDPTACGGEFAGPRLRGTVETMGMDWPSWRQDGAMLIDARLTLRTDDDELIAMTYTGISFVDPSVYGMDVTQPCE